MAYKVLWDEVPPGTKAWDPENRLIFGVGPLTGTGAPLSGRVSVTSLWPVTEGELPATGHMGGHWGPELKYAGWDSIIIQGKADRIDRFAAVVTEATPSVWFEHRLEQLAADGVVVDDQETPPTGLVGRPLGELFGRLVARGVERGLRGQVSHQRPHVPQEVVLLDRFGVVVLTAFLERAHAVLRVDQRRSPNMMRRDSRPTPSAQKFVSSRFFRKASASWITFPPLAEKPNKPGSWPTKMVMASPAM